MQMNSCILSICIIIRAIALQKNLATATKYSRSNMQEEKAINAKSDQISYNMHGDDFQGYRFCTFQNIPLNVSSFQRIKYFLRCSQYNHSVDFKQVEYYTTKMNVYVVWCPTNIELELHPTESSCYCLDKFCCNHFFKLLGILSHLSKFLPQNKLIWHAEYT